MTKFTPAAKLSKSNYIKFGQLATTVHGYSYTLNNSSLLFCERNNESSCSIKYFEILG
jgi:hypothetical protein